MAFTGLFCSFFGVMLVISAFLRIDPFKIVTLCCFIIILCDLRLLMFTLPTFVLICVWLCEQRCGG